MIIAGTGHRPMKLGGYSYEAFLRLQRFAITQLVAQKPKLVISGMALGWDQALATAAYTLGIPFHAYIPFEGVEAMWPHRSKDYYNWLRSKAVHEIVVSDPGYAGFKMQARNEAMVNICNEVLALWDGTEGGTGNCVRYAQEVKKPIRNVWDSWEKFE